MENKCIKFYYINKQGRKIIYDIHKNDLSRFKITLMERSFTEDIGDVYMESKEGWIRLDYYNN